MWSQMIFSSLHTSPWLSNLLYHILGNNQPISLDLKIRWFLLEESSLIPIFFFSYWRYDYHVLLLYPSPSFWLQQLLASQCSEMKMGIKLIYLAFSHILLEIQILISRSHGLNEIYRLNKDTGMWQNTSLFSLRSLNQNLWELLTHILSTLPIPSTFYFRCLLKIPF